MSKVFKEKGILLSHTELDEFTEIARVATREELSKYEGASDLDPTKLFLESSKTKESYLFELYIESDQKEEKLISTVVIDRATKNAEVIISNLNKKQIHDHLNK